MKKNVNADPSALKIRTCDTCGARLRSKLELDAKLCETHLREVVETMERI